jgi:hypothetical protein
MRAASADRFPPAASPWRQADSGRVWRASPGACSGKASSRLAGLGFPVQATRGGSARCDALCGLFEALRRSLDRLDVRLAQPGALGPASRTVAVHIPAHLPAILAPARKPLKPKRRRPGRLGEQRSCLARGSASPSRPRSPLWPESARQSRYAERARPLPEACRAGSPGDCRRNAAGGRRARWDLRRRVCFFLRSVRRSVLTERLELRAKLSPVDGAGIGSQGPGGRVEDTRVRILEDLRGWSRDVGAPRIFRLDGMAGTGKSAIAREFSRTLRGDQLLGGTFFLLAAGRC